MEAVAVVAECAASLRRISTGADFEHERVRRLRQTWNMTCAFRRCVPKYTAPPIGSDCICTFASSARSQK